MSKSRSPTMDEFLTFSRAALAFLTDEFGFHEEPLSSDDQWLNPYQLWFASSGVRVIVEGINYGFGAEVSISPQARPKVKIPAHWLLPHGTAAPTPSDHLTSSQLRAVYVGAECLRRWGATALRGDLDQLEARHERLIKAVRRRPTDAQIAERAFASAATEAGHAFKRGEYSRVVELLAPHEPRLSRRQSKMLEYARERR